MTNHLWQSTIFAVSAGLLTVVFRKNRAQVRYWLWLSASIKFLIPFSLLMSLGSHLEWAPAARTTAIPVVSSTMIQFTQPFPETASFVPSTAGSPDWVPVTILGVWACGFAVIAMIRFRGWLRIRAAMRSSSPLELPVTVDVRSSPGLLEPGVVGFLRPILLLPEGIAECLTPRQLEAVLAHELCHVRRRDNLTSAIHMIVEAVFWFHPLVWWIGARLVEERERACDEAVLSLGSEPQVYAEGILNVCKIYLESPLRCVSGVTGSDLKKRIQAILTGRVAGELNFAKRVALAVAGIAALALPVIVGILNAPAVRAQSGAGVKPKFEVASIRPCEPGRRGRLSVTPGSLHTSCISLAALASIAYGVDLRFPIQSEGPAWIKSDGYDIEAKAEGTPSAQTMQGPMLQALLEDRFKLKIRRDSREVPIYALTVAKSGFKLQPLKEGSCAPYDPLKPPQLGGQTPAEIRAAADATCANAGTIGLRKAPTGPVTVNFHGMNLNDFSKALDRAMDRSIINKTGIIGMFDIHMEFAPDEAVPAFMPGGRLLGYAGPATPPPPQGDPIGGPSIFTAIQEQLGLRLEPTKGPGEFFIIVSAERPSEN
jgi:bla regulator protein BlaR1